LRVIGCTRSQLDAVTAWQVTRYAASHGFRVTPAHEADRYAVRSVGSRTAVFWGTLRECYVWLLGYTWNHGVQP